MKLHHYATAALALSGALAAPAAAQVNGIAITDPAVAIAGSQALQGAYGQIGTTFQAQITQIGQLQQQRDALVRPFDTDGNGQLSEAEQAAYQANTAAQQQIAGVEQQIAQVQQPITQARVYALEQIVLQFNPAMQQVISDKGIQLILTPQAAVYAAEPVDVTDEIVAALNARVPSVSTAVPQGWQPQRQSVSLYQEVQQILVQAAMQQQQAASAAQPQPPVEGR